MATATSAAELFRAPDCNPKTASNRSTSSCSPISKDSPQQHFPTQPNQHPNSNIKSQTEQSSKWHGFQQTDHRLKIQNYFSDSMNSINNKPLTRSRTENHGFNRFHDSKSVMFMITFLGGLLSVVMTVIMLSSNLRESIRWNHSDKMTPMESLRCNHPEGNGITPMDSALCNVLESEHNDGQWIRTTLSRESTWPCCGWDNNHFKRYPDQCGTSPMKRDSSRSYVGNRHFYAHGGGNGCDGPCEPTDGYIISAQWTPTKCALPLFNASYFCTNLLRNRSLLVIGDSTMVQTATILMNSVHYHCPEQIRFASGDTLIGVNLGVLNRGTPWKESVHHFDPDIVMMSAGEHVRKQEDYQRVLESVYEQFVEEYGSTMGDKLLIWKTINPGGINAFGIVDEIPNLDDKETMGRWKDEGYQEDWRWDLSRKHDQMAKDHWRSKGVAVLDVEPLYYRMDNHPGTNVHHCAHGDGALRLIPRLLQKLLEELTE